MPVYRVNIDRTVTTYDRFTRYIRANTPDEAEAIADRLASDADSDCPDDAGPGNFDNDLGSWLFNDLEETAEVEAGYAIIGPDGEEEGAEDDE